MPSPRSRKPLRGFWGRGMAQVEAVRLIERRADRPRPQIPKTPAKDDAHSIVYIVYKESGSDPKRTRPPPIGDGAMRCLTGVGGPPSNVGFPRRALRAPLGRGRPKAAGPRRHSRLARPAATPWREGRSRRRSGGAKKAGASGETLAPGRKGNREKPNKPARRAGRGRRGGAAGAPERTQKSRSKANFATAWSEYTCIGLGNLS